MKETCEACGSANIKRDALARQDENGRWVLDSLYHDRYCNDCGFRWYGDGEEGKGE